jgi:hypothetical protein
VIVKGGPLGLRLWLLPTTNKVGQPVANTSAPGFESDEEDGHSSSNSGVYRLRVRVLYCILTSVLLGPRRMGQDSSRKGSSRDPRLR